MDVDLQFMMGIALSILALAGTLASMFLKMHRLISRFETAESRMQSLFDANEPARIDTLEQKVEKLVIRENKRKQDAKVMLMGLRACLDGLHEQGCNGPVNETRDMLHRYIIESR